MKKIVFAILAILVVFQATAGTFGGIVLGRATKSCNKKCQEQYQQGYQDGLKACKIKGNH